MPLLPQQSQAQQRPVAEIIADLARALARQAAADDDARESHHGAPALPSGSPEGEPGAPKR